jgi:hypothetical protein
MKRREVVRIPSILFLEAAKIRYPRKQRKYIPIDILKKVWLGKPMSMLQECKLKN